MEKSIPALTSRESRDLDRRATEEFHIPAETLMENAGKAAAEQSLKFLEKSGTSGPWKVLILCGGGNNGGDGLVTARILREKGNKSEIVFLKPRESLKGLALLNFERAENLNIPCEFLPKTDILEQKIEEAHLLIDALLGTGFKGALSDGFKTAIEKMNSSGKPILSIDVPSGLDSDSGQTQGSCVRAQLTVAMGAMKKGFLNETAKEFTGKVVVADIGYPHALLQEFKPPAGTDFSKIS